jgi:hypothetical protein
MSSLVVMLTIDRPLCPTRELFCVFDDFHRNLIITFERLLGVGPEWFHPALAIFHSAGFVDFEIEPSFVDDPEKYFIVVQAKAAEHPPRFDVFQLMQLIEHEIFERIVLLVHQPANPDYSRYKETR